MEYSKVKSWQRASILSAQIVLLPASHLILMNKNVERVENTPIQSNKISNRAGRRFVILDLLNLHSLHFLVQTVVQSFYFAVTINCFVLPKYFTILQNTEISRKKTKKLQICQKEL